MQSNTQFIREAIIDYVDSVMKRQSLIHIMSACLILVKRQYRKRHEKVETYMHLLLRNGTNRHTHTHSDKYKVLWNFNIQTDKVIEVS